MEKKTVPLQFLPNLREPSVQVCSDSLARIPGRLVTLVAGLGGLAKRAWKANFGWSSLGI